MKLITLVCDVCSKSGEFVSGEPTSPWYEARKPGIVDCSGHIEGIGLEFTDSYKREEVNFAFCSQNCLDDYNSILKMANLLSEIAWVKAVKAKTGLKYSPNVMNLDPILILEPLPLEEASLERLVEEVREKRSLSATLNSRTQAIDVLARQNARLRNKAATRPSTVALFICAIGSLLLNIFMLFYFMPQPKTASFRGGGCIPSWGE